MFPAFGTTTAERRCNGGKKWKQVQHWDKSLPSPVLRSGALPGSGAFWLQAVYETSGAQTGSSWLLRPRKRTK